jgi:hypothetical protein
MKKLLFILFLLFVGCVKDPDPPTQPTIDYGEHGAYIMCEGIWGQGNASLARYDMESGKINNKYFREQNEKNELGDLANDMKRLDSTFLVVMASAKEIYEISLDECKLLRKLKLEGNRLPREIALFDNESAYVTDLYAHSILKFNYLSFEVLNERIETGPAPEGIAVGDGKVLVCNSGYGDYLADKPKAGTVSIINGDSEVMLLEDVPNVTEIVINEQTGRFYAAYLNLPSLEDSLGGIVEYDLIGLEEIRRWRLDPLAITLDTASNNLYYISNSLYRLDLNNFFAKPELVIKNQDTTNHWYGFAINPIDGNYWICDAKNYAINGELLIYDRLNTETPVARKPLGVNPSKIIFY